MLAFQLRSLVSPKKHKVFFSARTALLSRYGSSSAGMKDSKKHYDGWLCDGRFSPIPAGSAAGILKEMKRQMNDFTWEDYESQADGKRYRTNKVATMEDLDSVEPLHDKVECLEKSVNTLRQDLEKERMERIKFSEILDEYEHSRHMGEISGMALSLERRLEGLSFEDSTKAELKGFKAYRNQLFHRISLNYMVSLLEQRPWVEKYPFFEQIFHIYFGMSFKNVKRYLDSEFNIEKLVESRANRFHAGSGSKEYFAAFTRWSKSVLSDSKNKRQIRKNKEILEDLDAKMEVVQGPKNKWNGEHMEEAKRMSADYLQETKGNGGSKRI